MEKKKLLVSLAALATGLIGLHSCNSMKETTPPGGELHEVEVVVTLDEPVTKTVNQDNKTLWVEGDKISVIGTEYGEEEYIANSLSYRGNNTFGGRISYPGDDNNWYFAYPYREDNVTPQETHITVDEVQTQIGNDNMEHIAGEGFPLIGKVLALPRADQISVHMTNVLARLDYVINNTLETPIVVKQVVFTAPQKIGGNFVGDMTKDNISWTAKSGSYHSVTLNVEEGEEIAAEGQAAFHAGILATTINAGESMKIKIVAVDPSAPNTEIVFYKEYPMTSKQHLMAGKTYDFTLNFDADHQTDPNPQTEDPDEPENPDDPNPGGNDEPTTVPAYVKVTKAPDSWDGIYLIVDENSSKAFAAFAGNASSYAVNVTIQDGKILATNDNAKYALTVSDAGVQHDNASGQEAYNVKNSDGKYIFFSSGTIQILDTNQKVSGGSSSGSQYTYYHTFQYDNGVQVMSSGHSSGFNKYYLGYNNSNFSYYTESSSSSSESYYMSNASGLRVQLYKLSEVSGGGSSDPTKLNQTLSFAQSSVTLTMATAGGTQAVQTVSGAQTNVTYSSSNSDVATVSGTTITIKGFGSTNITATAEETDTYNSASAYYTLNVQQSGSSTVTTYTKASSLTVGGTYLIVDVDDQRLFKGNADGTYVSVSPSNGVISDPTNSYAGYEFTVTQSGNKYCLVFNDGKYLLCDYSTSGNSTTGLTFESSKPADNYLYSVTVNNGAFEFMTAQRNSSSTSEVLYYKTSSMSGNGQDKFKIGASGAGIGVHLYLKTASGSGSGSGKQNQTLSFANPTVTLTMATASGTQSVQTVSGAQTTVTYSSSNTNVATVSGTTITIKGFGSTTITATAAESNNYNSASAAYTLNIQQSGSSSESSSRTYTYQTSVSAGTYLLGGYESSNSGQYSIALFPTVLTGNWESSQGTVTNGEYIGQRDITSDNTLTFSNDSEIFNAEVDLIASGNNWKIRINSTGKYLAVPSQDNRIVYVDNESSATAFSISGGTGSGSSWGGSSSGSSMGISSGSYYFYHSGSAHGFSMRAYQVTNIRLYKKTSEGGSTSGKQNQNLSFSQATVTQNMASASGTLSVQTVSGAQTTVTYSSSNSNVATVSGTTITIHGFGSTTITATAAENSNYNSASASYTLIINQSSGGGSSTGERTYTYVAPNNLQEGTYIIAGSETNELSVALFPTVNTGSWNSQQTGQVNNGEYVPHKVYGSNNSATTITTTDSAIIGGEVELTKNGSNWRILVKSNNQYLASPSQEYRITYTGNASSAANFSISSGTNGATVQTGSYYFYHSGSAGGFTLRTSSTANVRFYQLTSGGDSSGKQYQSLSFNNSTETIPTEIASGTYQVQQVKGAQTSVTYSSSNTNVATVNGTTLTITGFGSTTITATAASNDNYYSASASYTLTVKRSSQTGVYNLENEAVMGYLDAALAQYTSSNRSNSIVGNYAVNVGKNNRLDWPAPVTISWSSTNTSGNKSVYIYSDAAHTQQIDYIKNPQTVSTSNSLDVYNLIPGRTYYYVVRNGNTEVASGEFSTEGRRRMIRIGSQYGQNFANNYRDLGGQTTTNSKKIKYGKLFRGTNMDGTDPNATSGGSSWGGWNTNGFGDATGPIDEEAEANIFDYLKIGLDVDLRGSGSAYGTNMNNKHQDRLKDITVGDVNTWQGHTQETYASEGDLTSNNKQYDGNTKTKMGVTLTRIMKAAINGTNVYIHCMVGADRTGFTCMMLEAILGVPLERCDIDYELTSFSGVGGRYRSGSSAGHYKTGVDAVQGRLSNQSNATYQDKAIDYVVNVHGVDRNLITQFQNTMLE